jgi:hypothetical protein
LQPLRQSNDRNLQRFSAGEFVPFGDDIMGRAFDGLAATFGRESYLHTSGLAKKGQLSQTSSRENVVLDIGHGGCFESPSALATGKQIAVGDIRSSTNSQQLAQDGCSLLTVLAAYMRISIPGAIRYLDRTCRNSRSSTAFHCFSISARLLVAKGGTDLPLM